MGRAYSSWAVVNGTEVSDNGVLGKWQMKIQIVFFRKWLKISSMGSGAHEEKENSGWKVRYGA
jgi:hypothetical protein